MFQLSQRKFSRSTASLGSATTPNAYSWSKLRRPKMSASSNASSRRRTYRLWEMSMRRISTFGMSLSPSCSVTLDKRMLTSTSAWSCCLATKYQQFLKKSRIIVFMLLQRTKWRWAHSGCSSQFFSKCLNSSISGRAKRNRCGPRADIQMYVSLFMLEHCLQVLRLQSNFIEQRIVAIMHCQIDWIL